MYDILMFDVSEMHKNCILKIPKNFVLALFRNSALRLNSFSLPAVRTIRNRLVLKALYNFSMFCVINFGHISDRTKQLCAGSCSHFPLISRFIHFTSERGL